MNRLILILSLGVLMFAFQNCAKPSLDSTVVCHDCEGDPELKNKQTPISSQGLQLFVSPHSSLGGETAEAYSHRIDVASNTLSLLSNRTGCDMSNSATWQELKSLITSRGLCEYTYTSSPDTFHCMAYPIPFALARNLSGDHPLSNGICGQPHTTICGQENFENFSTLFNRLRQDLQADALCN